MKNPIYKDVTEEQTASNSYARLVSGQKIVEIPGYDLECGESLRNFPVAYKTWGRLNQDRDNVIVVCHALTGSSDVKDWWGPLLGTGMTFDPSRFLIICINTLGSPYGSASPVAIDKATGKPYGPSFPLVTIKDEVKIQKLILDSLSIKSLACVIGGSMGGMIALEYSAMFNGTSYIKSVIAIATSARSSAWCISWNETQRQCIFSDPNYDEGYYYENGEKMKPDSGLSAARMAALLTYRSRNSFEDRFGRKLPKNNSTGPENDSSIRYPQNQSEQNWLLHNDGARRANHRKSSSSGSDLSKPQTHFTAQSYLRYQGNKFIARFDANCYISITRKLDTHDITRNRIEVVDESDPLPAYLKQLESPHLVIGIKSDGLFTYSEQQVLGDNIPNSILEELDSAEGHDAFLLEFEIVNDHCLTFLQKNIPEFYDPNSSKVEIFGNWQEYSDTKDNGGNSVFGEAEANITNW